MSLSGFFVLLKYCAFAVFVGVSGFLNINMFYQLATNPYDQFLLIVVAISLELLKVFLLVQAGAIGRLGLKEKARVWYGFYAALALISIVTSYGFTLTTINSAMHLLTTNSTSLEIDGLLTQKTSTLLLIEDLNHNGVRLKDVEQRLLSDKSLEIERRPQDTSFINRSYAGRLAEAHGLILANEERIRQTTRDLIELDTAITQSRIVQVDESTESKNTTKMFYLIGEATGIPAQSLMMGLLMIISVMIEVGLFITNPKVTLRRKHLSHFLGELTHEEQKKVFAILTLEEKQNAVLAAEARAEEDRSLKRTLDRLKKKSKVSLDRKKALADIKTQVREFDQEQRLKNQRDKTRPREVVAETPLNVFKEPGMGVSIPEVISKEDCLPQVLVEGLDYPTQTQSTEDLVMEDEDPDLDTLMPDVLEVVEAYKPRSKKTTRKVRKPKSTPKEKIFVVAQPLNQDTAELKAGLVTKAKGIYEETKNALGDKVEYQMGVYNTRVKCLIEVFIDGLFIGLSPENAAQVALIAPKPKNVEGLCNRLALLEDNGVRVVTFDPEGSGLCRFNTTPIRVKELAFEIVPKS